MKLLHIFFLVLIGMHGILMAQVLNFDDSTFTSIPYGENFQSIDLEYSIEKDSFFLYTAFDLVTHSRINVYRTRSLTAPANLKLSRVFTLPTLYRHPNNIQIIGDSLLVCGTNNDNVSNIAMFNKNNGGMFNEVIDTLPKDAVLRSVFFHRGVIYRLVSESLKFDLQWYRNGKFSTVKALSPSPMRDINNYVQGTTVLFERFLVVLTSFPTRMDFYDLKNNLQYLGRYFGEYNGLESEGIAQFTRNDTAYVYYGLRFPNKINILRFPKYPAKPTLLFPEDGAIISATTVSLGWKTAKGAFHYDVSIASDVPFQAPVREENGILNPLFLTQLPKYGTYYWRVRSSNLINTSSWSSTYSMRVDILTSLNQESNISTSPKSEVFPPYPNPFNNSSIIKFSLAYDEDVNISLYDITGRFIKNIVSQPMKHGIHSVKIDADDLSAGLYIGKVTTGRKNDFIKLNLIK
ncbi:MAG: T9SS type A sorting domain-containing protein [Bacteroidetes bacterium]|nr:T9SS type A sorting domain-containing protein [Bacteroidota bacterium]